MKKASRRLGIAVAVLGLMTGIAGSSRAELQIAIVEGGFYTPNLKNQLTSAGQNVTEITSYTADSLVGYDTVIVYGNAFTDMDALTTYVMGGGTLIETPWFWKTTLPPAQLQIFSNEGEVSYSESSPGINVLAAGDPLLSSVAVPAGPGGFNIGRTTGNSFVAGVEQVANWADGTAFLGRKTLGIGSIVGINLHLITSDAAYQVVDQPWATQLVLNAANITETAAVPEPSTIALACSAIPMGLGFAWRRRHKVVTA